MQPSPKYNGDPTAQALAHGLATLGRYGDDYMVHASEGETVIPREILDANPQLKQDLFRQMIMMGIQDPNRYVVGSALNSLNPITGQPEFFFKKIWRAAKKIFKKAAPIIAPILGNLIAPGIGGLIASALTTKLMGGSWGDALKAGALSWGTQGLMGGIGGLGEGGSGFFSGMGEGLMSPVKAVGGIFQGGAASPFAQGILGPKGIGALYPSLAGTKFADQGVGLLPQYQGKEAFTDAGIDWKTGAGLPQPGDPSFIGPSLPPIERRAVRTMREAAELWGRGVDVTRGEDGLIRQTAPKLVTGMGTGMGTSVKPPEVPLLKSKELWGPLISGGGLGALAYVLTPDEEAAAKKVGSLAVGHPHREAYEKWQKMTNKDDPAAVALKDIWYGRDRYSKAELLTKWGATGRGAPRGIAAARGGEVVGRGTGTSDSIPARLSDGEFVMTADAVRNAGNGNRDLGAARMYDMMSRFERRG